MDKNMIHIDDLVRQRLGGAEERERPGAWLNMRDLLDQKMPVAPPAGGYQWRRMLGVMSGLVLLSVLTVGSYHIATSTKFRDDNSSSAKLASAKAGKHSNHASVNTGNSTAVVNTGIQETYTPANNTGTAVAKNNTLANRKADVKTTGIAKTSAATRKATSVSTGANMTAKNVRAANKDVTAAAVNGTAKVETTTRNDNSSLASSNTTAVTQNITASANNNTPATNRNSTASNPGNTPSGNTSIGAATKADEKVFASNTASKPVIKAKQLPGDKVTNILPSVKAVVPAADNTATAKQGLGDPFRLKDSIQKLTIVQRFITNPYTRKGRFVNDTISVARMAVDKEVLTSLTGNAPVAHTRLTKNALEKNNDINVGASASMNAAKADAAMEGFVPLANYKVHSRKTNAWDAQRFDEAMREAKFKLSQVRFYPGVSFGGSYSAGQNKIPGVQFGLFGLFTFGENWNAMAELKYVHKFNNGKTVQDNYYSIDSTVVSGQRTYLQSKVEHFFKFSTLQSIEMPLALRYAAGRINIIGGINMAYNFKVDAEEITLQPNDSAYAATSDPNWANVTPTTNYTDFGPRFSLGYLLGAGVELTPALQLDLRMTKNFWDNGSGTGSALISNQLYRAPSFQVSLFYRFSQKNQIPKAK